MATREVSNGTRTIERWTNTGTPGYYSGNPLIKQRDLSAAELAELAAMDAGNVAAGNEETIRAQALAALAANRTFVQSAKPSTAALQASAAYDQAKAQARQLNGVIRLLLGALDSTE